MKILYIFLVFSNYFFNKSVNAIIFIKLISRSFNYFLYFFKVFSYFLY